VAGPVCGSQGSPFSLSVPSFARITASKLTGEAAAGSLTLGLKSTTPSLFRHRVCECEPNTQTHTRHTRCTRHTRHTHDAHDAHDTHDTHDTQNTQDTQDTHVAREVRSDALIKGDLLGVGVERLGQPFPAQLHWTGK